MSDYSDKLKSPKWQRKRLEIMKRDKFKCKKCSDEETTLNVHHKVYNDGADPWEYDNSDLVTLCEHCHFEIEQLSKEENDFDDIKIYKSDDWKGGSRIMFISRRDVCTMRIFGDDHKFVIGFNFTHIEIPQIIKILKKVS